MQWAEGLDSADLQSAALKSALQTWGANDPEAAARRALDIKDLQEQVITPTRVPTLAPAFSVSAPALLYRYLSPAMVVLLTL